MSRVHTKSKINIQRKCRLQGTEQTYRPRARQIDDAENLKPIPKDFSTHNQCKAELELGNEF